MKITIPKQDLQDTVNKVKSVVASKTALPILSHIYMEAEGTTLRLASTDLKVSIECRVDCTVHQAGAMTVASQRISSILSELPDKDVTITLGENNVIELECGGSETKLFSMAPEEFPPIRSFEGIDPLVFRQGTLKKLFQKTSFAICSDQARYNLTGLLFQVKDGKLVVVATDGRRMSLAMDTEGIPEAEELKIIIPEKAIRELERLFGDEDEVQVFIDESQAGFSFGNVRLVTSLIEGNFPNYEMVVPKKHDKEVIADTPIVTEAMRRARTLTNDKFNTVRISVADGQMELRVTTPEVGEYHEEIPVVYDGERVEISFNPEFILEVLRRIESDKTCFVLKDAMSPGVVKPYTEAPQDDYVNVVMPIRM